MGRRGAIRISQPDKIQLNTGGQKKKKVTTRQKRRKKKKKQKLGQPRGTQLFDNNIFNQDALQPDNNRMWEGRRCDTEKHADDNRNRNLTVPPVELGKKKKGHTTSHIDAGWLAIRV